MFLLTILEHKAMREGVGIHTYELGLKLVLKQGQVDTNVILKQIMKFS